MEKGSAAHQASTEKPVSASNTGLHRFEARELTPECGLLLLAGDWTFLGRSFSRMFLGPDAQFVVSPFPKDLNDIVGYRVPEPTSVSSPQPEGPAEPMPGGATVPTCCQYGWEGKERGAP